MDQKKGAEGKELSFVDTAQMAALVDSWATRFGALAVLELMGRSLDTGEAFWGIVLIAKAVLCFYAVQPLYQYFKIEMDRIAAGSMFSTESVKIGGLFVAFVVTLGVTFEPVIGFYNISGTPVGAIGFVVVVFGGAAIIALRARLKAMKTPDGHKD